MAVKIGKISLKNPVMVASGTFGAGEEHADFTDINKLGALVTKTITLRARQGNRPPRVVETSSGMLNSIGLENAGVDYFIEHKMPFLKRLAVPVIVSAGGESADDLVELVRRLEGLDISGIELNLSCPNVHGGAGKERGHGLISQSAEETRRLVKKIRAMTRLTLIAKLSPNVTDIAAIACAAQDGGSDAVSLVNTFLGMAVDIRTRRPKLGAVTGGLSGPAIKPLALRMVWETFKKVSIPVIGIGGIMNANDALEFILCGATAVQIGTANFIDPSVTADTIEGIGAYLKEHNLKNIHELRGAVAIS